MQNLHFLNRYRDTGPQVMQLWGTVGDDSSGRFFVPSPIDGAPMTVIASAYEGWDHVSVSRGTRCPNWPEMDHIKRMFFRADETAMQLHVPDKDHINVHPYCLHLWRPHARAIPRPPADMVAVQSEEVA